MRERAREPNRVWAHRVYRRGLGHLGRLGGTVVAPRRTLRGILWWSEGHLAEVLVWMGVTVAVVEPVRTGRVLLMAQVGLLDAVSMFFGLFASRMTTPLVCAGAGALALRLFARGPDGARPPLYAALDACAFMLVPYLVLAALGTLLQGMGVGPRWVWYLPHQPLRGAAWVVTVRTVVAFAIPLALWIVLWLDVRRRGAAE